MSQKKLDGDIQNFLGYTQIANDVSSIENYLFIQKKLQNNCSIRQYIVYHTGDFEKIILKQATRFSKFIQINPNICAYKITLEQTDSQDLDGVICVIPGNQENFSRIITICYSNYWDAVVRKRLIKKLTPEAIPVFFKQEELEKAMGNLENLLPPDAELLLSDVTSKEIRANGKTEKEKQIDTLRLWTAQPWRDVFNQAKHDGKWFLGLKFVIRKKNKIVPITSGKIYKRGEIYFDSNYDIITRGLINSLENQASERFMFLKNRGIKERNYVHSESLEITFDEDVFQNIEDIHKFHSVINNYPNSTKAIYHSNPFFHASIADFLDGSSIDLWILSRNKIVLIPQAKSSVFAFNRLITHIYDTYGEGKVETYAK